MHLIIDYTTEKHATMMTFEEFKRLAIHPPRKREKTIFHISLVTIDTDRLDYPNSEEVTEEEYGKICDRIDALSEEERASRRVYYPFFLLSRTVYMLMPKHWRVPSKWFNGWLMNRKMSIAFL